MDKRDQSIGLPRLVLVNQEVETVLLLVVKGEHKVPVVPGILSRRQQLPEPATFLGIGFDFEGIHFRSTATE